MTEFSKLAEPEEGEAGVFNAGVGFINDDMVIYYRVVDLDKDYPKSKLGVAVHDENGFTRLGRAILTYDNDHLREICQPRGDNSFEDPRVVMLDDKPHLTFVVLEHLPYTDVPQFASTFLAEIGKDLRTLNVVRCLTPEDWLGRVDDRHVIPFANGDWMLTRPQRRGEDEGYYDAHILDRNLRSSIYLANGSDREKERRLIFPRPGVKWEAMGIGGAAAEPIWTPDGWRVYYMAKGSDGSADHIYNIGIAVLDHDKPWIIKYQSSAPILSPDPGWNDRFPLLKNPDRNPAIFGKKNVLFVCGVIHRKAGDTLVFGANDRYIGQAFNSEEEITKNLEEVTAGN